jgi:hypothetical protein
LNGFSFDKDCNKETERKATNNMSAVQINALTEFETILRKALPSVELPSNLVELMLAAMKDSERDRLNDFSFVKPKIEQIMKSSLKDTVKLLPFMPDRIDYMIDQGRCGAIEFDFGLFTPCCKACVSGEHFCKGHMEKPSPYGTYEERLLSWDDGHGVGNLSFTIRDEAKDKDEIKEEITYGEYLLKKKISPEKVKQALKETGLFLRLHPHDMQVRDKPKKARGRPSEKKVQAVTLDGEEESSGSESPEVKPKPVKVRLSPEEKAAAVLEAEKVKEQKRLEREEKKKLLEIRKQEEAIIKTQQQAEKLAAKAAEKLRQAEEKAAAKAAGTKPKPKGRKVAATDAPTQEVPPLGTSLDAIYFDGDLEELEESEGPDGTKFWYDDERNVYDASKKKVGTINDEGDLVLL